VQTQLPVLSSSNSKSSHLADPRREHTLH